MSTPEQPVSPNFVRDMITADREQWLAAETQPAADFGERVRTRFPPEPNGYLHIGHAKAICINFGMALEFGGTCNLRFVDTNPSTEDIEYVEAIQRDIRWLGFDWGETAYFASDTFERMYECAVHLVRAGKAYVDSQTATQIRDKRGNFHRPGEDSPFRARSIEVNLDLFARMRAGEFAEGEHVLRAKIDMQHGNLNLRDPLLYRISNQPHHRTGSAWCIYPMYDYAHPLEDAFEGITYSLCSLEFQDHRPLYDWVIENAYDGPLSPTRPRQTEFARLNLGYTVMSKRKLLQLVTEKHVEGWDDPRMSTLSGMRRRGIPPEAIIKFCERIGVSRRDSLVDVSLFEHAVREHLNEVTPRYLGVLDPLEVVIDNYPEHETEFFDAPLHPDDARHGTRKLPFSRVLYIEQDDFRMTATRKWFRLAPGKEVRLRYACLLTCQQAITDETGKVVRLHCTWDPNSRGGTSPDGRKVKGTLHWVSAEHAIPAEVRLYDRLFTKENPLEGEGDFLACLNPNSRQVVTTARLEPALADLSVESRVQLERLGYFCVDQATRPGSLVLNRTITLADTWAKVAAAGG